MASIKQNQLSALIDGLNGNSSGRKWSYPAGFVNLDKSLPLLNTISKALASGSPITVRQIAVVAILSSRGLKAAQSLNNQLLANFGDEQLT